MRVLLEGVVQVHLPAVAAGEEEREEGACYGYEKCPSERSGQAMLSLSLGR